LVDENFGGVDILINNAGVGIFQAAAELKPEDWTRTLETNLTGAFHCCQEALSRFRRRGGGFIINIGSLAGRNAFAGGAAYNASKFGLLGFTEALMLDHRNENVRVSTIMPGSVATEFSREAGSGAHGSEWKIAVDDVAEVVVAILKMPERTLVSRVEMRPSRPRN
jgi:NADP-dependent 3-hydroxy acid dehydrogenase YdfG